MADDIKTYTQEEVDALIAEQTSGLKANRDELIKEAKKAKDALKNYEGVDPDEFKRLKHAAEEAERKKAAAEGDFKSLEKQLVERHTKELEAERTKTQKALNALDKRKVANLTKALSEADALPEMLDLLVLRGKDAIRLREGDEDWEEYIADEKGNPLVADGKGTPMDIKTFVEQNLKAKYPGAFRGTGSSGGGASKSSGSAGGAKVINAGDSAALLANLEGVAKGTVEIR